MIKLVINTLLYSLFFGSISYAKNLDLSLHGIAPKKVEIPDPKIKKMAPIANKNKSLTKLEMTDHVFLQPRLEYDDYLNIKPNKPQTFGFNLFWDI